MRTTRSCRPALESLEGRFALSGDVTGASVLSAAFSGSQGSFSSVRVAFSEPINPVSFTAADVLSLTDPVGNAIPIGGVTPVAGTDDRFDVTFPTQSTPGTYTIRTGVDILDLAGNTTDQNRNGTNGESPGDEFTGTATLSGVPIPAAFFAVGASDGSIQIVDADTSAIVISGIRLLDADGVPYMGLVEVAVGDLNGDGTPDVFAAAANPAGSQGLAASKAGRVFAYDGGSVIRGGSPTLLREFVPFATTEGPAGSTGPYVNGLNVAVADVNGDGTLDLVAGTRGGNGTATGGNREVGRLVVIDGNSSAGSNFVIGGVRKPFGGGYEKGVVVAAGNADGTGGDEVAVTRGGPVASTNPAVQRIKLKVLQLRNGALAELPLNADGSTAFPPFVELAGPANAIRRDGRVAFVDQDGNGAAELVFSALDPLTDPANGRVRVGVFAINTTATAGAATTVSLGPDAGTYTTGSAVIDHGITHVAGTGTRQNLALVTESAASGLVYLAPLTGGVQPGGPGFIVAHGGVTIDGV